MAVVGYSSPKNMITAKQKFLSPAEYAEERGLSIWTLRSWMRLRLIPYIQLRRRILIDPEKADEAIRSFTREAK